MEPSHKLMRHHYDANNCTELLELLCSIYPRYAGDNEGIITFQGDDCEFGGIGGKSDLFIISPVFDGFVFGIDRGFYEDKTFTLSVFRGPVFCPDQTLGITLPKYVGNELISTIKGDENYPTEIYF